tara:strand:+ start:1917 stop:2234 length:318 start_codon:yes stop_codon:yes gene_type:complete
MQEPVQEEQAQLFDVENYEVASKEPISDEMLQDVALNAIGKIPMQDFINDAVQALVEVYKMKPAIFQLDVDNYDTYPPYLSNPFMDLVSYLQELNRETGTSNGAG